MFKKIQEKPEHVKKRISLVVTMVIFGVIVFVWVSSRTARMVINDSRTRTASPIESFKEIFNGGISDIQNTITSSEFFSGDGEGTVSDGAPPVILSQPASSTSRFDTSGVIIIDLATSTKGIR